MVVRGGHGCALVVLNAAKDRLGYVAKPREDRWHKRPVALFGGVGIGLSLLTVSLVSGVATEIPVLIICSMAMFAVGLSDDILSLKPSTKLVAQIALAPSGDAVWLAWSDGGSPATIRAQRLPSARGGLP